jgi:hypothetical protein
MELLQCPYRHYYIYVLHVMDPGMEGVQAQAQIKDELLEL